jgi:AcrR family transcriptional regulator
MTKNTYQRILDCATKCFAKKGFGAVSLFEISTELNISRGNLTYHFKDKDTLLKAIADGMWEEIDKGRRKSRQLPSFENLHNEVQLYHKLQKQYSFIFLDNHVMTHPLLKKKFNEMINQTIKDNEAAIAFAIASGNMKHEPFKGVYHNIAYCAWMIAFFWLAQKVIRGEKKSKDAEAIIWTLLIPNFTKKGIKSFNSFFGEDYIDNLGEPFDAKIQNYITF